MEIQEAAFSLSTHGFFVGHANWTISHVFGREFTFPSGEAGGKLLERRDTFAWGRKDYLGGDWINKQSKECWRIFQTKE